MLTWCIYLKPTLCNWKKEIYSSWNLPSLKWRLAKSLSNDVKEKCDMLIREYKSNKEIVSYINSLNLWIPIQLLEEAFRNTIKKAFLVSKKINSDDIDTIITCTIFHFIQSLKITKKKWIKSIKKRLSIASKSCILEWHRISTIYQEDVIDVKWAPTSSKFWDYFSISDISKIFFYSGDPEKKLKDVIQNVDELSEILITWIDYVPNWKIFSDYFSKHQITNICLEHTNPRKKIHSILQSIISISQEKIRW